MSNLCVLLHGCMSLLNATSVEEILRYNFIISSNRLVFLSLCYLISRDSVQSVERKRKVFPRETIKQEPDVTVLGYQLEDSSSPCVDFTGMSYSCNYVL